MTTEYIDTIIPVTQPEVPVTTAQQATEKTETADQNTAEKTPEQEAQEASEAAKTLSARKQAKADRYRQNEADKWQAIRERDAAARRAEIAEAQLAKYKAVEKPDPAAFTDMQSYDVANARYVNAQVRQEELADTIETEKQNAYQVSIRNHQRRAEDFMEEAPDYRPGAIVPLIRGLPSAGVVADEIMESESGPMIEHWLFQNPREAQRLAVLPAKQVVREVALIEARLTAPPPVKVTQAPPPVKSVGGNGSQTKAKSPDDMSYAEFRAFREKGGKI